MNHLLSAILWVIYGFSFVLSFLTGLVVRIFTFPFDKFNRYPNAVMMFFGKSIIVCNPFWKKHYFGLEKLDNRVPGYIRVANHQSFLDMPLLATLPTNMKWISKKELFKIPIVGWIMSLAGHISVDRGAKGAAKSLLAMNAPIECGTSVMIFPEGTRSREGKLKPFKKGAFYSSFDNKFDIQPIVIEGTYKCMKPDTWVMNLTGNLYVSVLEPISPENFSSVDELTNHVFNVIKQESDRLQSLDNKNT
ncbi:MAG: 1-acyl-sn-glycerol-3-phosphate acyltransferase [Balneolales bacterium]|nr:1-acyl-sn-glycerol-3-phosphate acyltransferase [Balneolales bacterium]